MRIWPGSFTLRQWIEKSWKYKLALLLLLAAGPVSYTHLDVYKRQVLKIS